MSAPADFMSHKRSATRPANMVTVWFTDFFVKLYVALDKTQRKRATEIIQQYAQRDENSGEQKKAFLSEDSGYEPHQFWPDIARNRKRRGSET